MAEWKSHRQSITSISQIESVVPWFESLLIEIDRGDNNVNFDGKQQRVGEILSDLMEISSNLGRSLDKSTEMH